MNLPYPFDNASGVKANPDGSISLIDAQGKALARLPLATAFELTTGAEGHGVQDYNDFDGSGSSVMPTPIGCRITCKDGFSVSIQASGRHYCLPRVDEGPWTHVELGFPSQPDPLISGYAEDFGDLTKTVYPYVPQEVVSCLIQSHGGVDHIT
jgi:hypothetical protein